jgi:hypothetical protein
MLVVFEWRQARLARADVRALIADYDWVREADSSLQLVQDVLRSSAYILARDPTQLASQLYEHLVGHEALLIQSLLRQIESARTIFFWLRPLASSPAAPQPPAGHLGIINALTV